MNILFLTLLDFSSILDSNIYTDLMKEFLINKHSVYIISQTEKRKKQKTKLIDEDGYKILKLQIGNIQKTNIIEKGISTLTLEYKFKKAIRKYYNYIKFDLVLYSTPPITLKKSIEFIKKRDQAKTYLLLKDIFPQNAVDLGMIKHNGLLFKYFRHKEKKLYSASDYIGCMSQMNIEFLLKHNTDINPNKVEVCPNSVEVLNIVKTEKEVKNIRVRFNIPLDKIVFIYGGNLGKPQGIEFLIECLKYNINNKKIFFVIVGSGTEQYKLENFINEFNPDNVSLLSQLLKSDYEELVSSCDVGLIFLDSRFTIPNFPSRILSYMQASMPVLAATDKNTDIGKVIEKGQFGYWCESSSIEKFSEKVQLLCNEEIRKTMGNNARKYLENNYTSKHSYDIIMKHFE